MEIVKNALLNYVLTIGWGIIGAITMSLSMGILIKIFDFMTPIDEWKEVEKGNLCVGIIIAAVIISFGIVIGLAVHGQ